MRSCRRPRAPGRQSGYSRTRANILGRARVRSTSWRIAASNPTSPVQRFTTDRIGRIINTSTARIRGPVSAQPVNYHDGFHTYAVEWDAKKLRFFIDDVNWYTLYDSDVGGTISQNAPMETVLNVAVGGDFLGGSDQQPDGSSVWPQTMQVDYVRVFERDNNVPITMQNGNFEANDGSLAGWSTFGNSANTNNISIHNEAAHGEASLKLFGQLHERRQQCLGRLPGHLSRRGRRNPADVSRFIRSQDSISGTNNNVVMRIEFYNEFGGKADTSAMLDAAEPDDRQRQLAEQCLAKTFSSRPPPLPMRSKPASRSCLTREQQRWRGPPRRCEVRQPQHHGRCRFQSRRSGQWMQPIWSSGRMATACRLVRPRRMAMPTAMATSMAAIFSPGSNSTRRPKEFRRCRCPNPQHRGLRPWCSCNRCYRAFD